jgi:hypothetical protein
MRTGFRVTLQEAAVVPQLFVQLGGQPISPGAITQASEQLTYPHRHTERNTR